MTRKENLLAFLGLSMLPLIALCAEPTADMWAKFGENLEEQSTEVVRNKAQAGDTDAQCVLAQRYMIGSFSTEEKHAKALEWYGKAAEGGNAEALYQMGRFYAMGEGVSADAKKATEYYRRAAEKNHKEAQWELGKCYQFGDGVEKDVQMAYVWYSISGENGYVIGQSQSVAMSQRLTPEQLKQAQEKLKKAREDLAVKAAKSAVAPTDKP